MFVLDVKKAKPTITNTEPLITSNSLNAFSVQFIFSEEWDGMQRFAVFKTPQSDPVQVLLDDTNIADIPSELLVDFGPKVLVGAYGLKSDGKEIRLPTIWITIDNISEGVLEGYEPAEPTPDIYSQFIEALNRLQNPGATFIPNVDSDGNISWTNDQEKPNPEARNIKGPKGDRGVTFTPSVSEDGDLSWTNDGDLPNPNSVDLTGPKGDQGVTFTPSVSEDGDLSWTNDGDLPNPETVNIKGPPGNDGQDGADGTDGEDGPQGPQGVTFTPSMSEDGDLSWTNDGGLDNPQTVNLKGPPSSIFVTAPVGAIMAWDDPDNIPTGWALCDGQNGTADYRDKFMLGASSDSPAGSVGGSVSGTSGEVYSTDETRIGTWIDGKPLYRKSANIIDFQATGLAQNIQVGFQLENFDLVRAYGFYRFINMEVSKNRYPIPFVEYDSNDIRYSTIMQYNNGIILKCKLYQGIEINGMVTIEYTKTTDEPVTEFIST